MIKIAIDAMGGDYAPNAVIEGSNRLVIYLRIRSFYYMVNAM